MFCFLVGCLIYGLLLFEDLVALVGISCVWFNWMVFCVLGLLVCRLFLWVVVICCFVTCFSFVVLI